MKKIIGMFLALCVITSLPLSAQTGVWFGPQVGLYKAQDANESRGMLGLALRMKLSDAVGIEGSLNYRRELYADDHISVRTWPVMVTGLLYPVPFLYGAIGAGWYNSRIEYSIPSGYLGGAAVITGETQQRFGWHFGGGLDASLTSSVKLFADIKYVFLDYEFQQFPGSNGVNSNFTVTSIGLLFAL